MNDKDSRKKVYNDEAEEQRLLRQFDIISSQYALATRIDPNKRYVQYPESLRMIGDPGGAVILDIGCANGTFTRMMRCAGAGEIIGFDPSENELTDARNEEAERPLGIRYVSDYSQIPTGKRFDLVTVIMVFPAVTSRQLEEIFTRSSKFLKMEGKLVAVTLNPDFSRFGEVVNGRIFSRRADGRIGIDFLDDGGKKYMSIIDTYFSMTDVERAARKAGFANVRWEALKIDPAGIEKYGTDYWAGYEEDCPYIGFVASRG
ncbi:MAG: class I SAM-dependent methyltransferase [Candidatus Moranbacteria bacterium]|nr:class I SAM-dependent methyltransferase [Candidatus Moranbacteria bacterium]